MLFALQLITLSSQSRAGAAGRRSGTVLRQSGGWRAGLTVKGDLGTGVGGAHFPCPPRARRHTSACSARAVRAMKGTGQVVALLPAPTTPGAPTRTGRSLLPVVFKLGARTSCVCEGDNRGPSLSRAGSPDLANARCAVPFEFQINNGRYLSIRVSHDM